MFLGGGNLRFYLRNLKGRMLDMAETYYRVMNKCRYDIGVKLANGRETVIRAGSFQLLNADDIFYIESLCRVNKYFAQRMLVPYDSQNKEVPLSEINMYPDESLPKHLTDEEIAAKLKLAVKKVEEWLEPIDDPAELFSICEVAKTLDLPQSKVKLLKDKVPAFDLTE